jgi:transcriptional regulator GlxA family with amidase domain
MTKNVVKMTDEFFMKNSGMKTIFILSTDQTSLPGVVGVSEVLNVANILHGIQNPGSRVFDFKVVSKIFEPFELVPGLKTQFTNGLLPYEQADAVIAPGFLYQSMDQLLKKLEESGEEIAWIKRQYQGGAIIGGSCSGSVLLAETGLLQGKQATTSWWLGQLYKKRYKKIDLKIKQMLIESHGIYTAGASTSYLNLALSMVNTFAGKATALSCSKMMLIDMGRYFQAPYMDLYSIADHSDDVVFKAQHWMQDKFHQKIDFKELSQMFAVSYRTFIRRFKSATNETPTNYLQKVRIEAAKRLLETTNLNVETIMDSVGYTDLSSFIQLFKRLTEISPSGYRNQFSFAKKQ